MKRTILTFFLFFGSTLNALSIVFVHIGNELPTYLRSSLQQARLFNEECSIYLLANQEALTQLSTDWDTTLHNCKISCIACEALEMSRPHKTFRKRSRHDRSFRDGFWIHASERFFYVAAFMKQYGEKDVFHLENDVMLYRDLRSLLPIFHENYSGMIGATLDNDLRCIPGIVYISDFDPLHGLITYMAALAHRRYNDMEVLSMYKRKTGRIHPLPIIPLQYLVENTLENQLGAHAAHPEEYTTHFDAFLSVFDGAALGQYLGGIDPRNGPSSPGFINESCLFDPSKFSYTWKVDEKGRSIPFLKYGSEEYQINNLHIHSKQLHEFQSQ